MGEPDEHHRARTGKDAVNISIQEMVRKDLLHREQLGIARYGTPLYPYNGRVAVLDAYEECLDMAVYLRQALAELGIDPNTTTNPPPHPTRIDAKLRRERPTCDCIDPVEYGQ
jgi:hypothetical protein